MYPGLSGLSGSVEPKSPQLKVELVPGAGWTLPWLSFVSCSVCRVHGQDFSLGEEWGSGLGTSGSCLRFLQMMGLLVSLDLLCVCDQGQLVF